jgi:hypothetical protein
VGVVFERPANFAPSHSHVSSQTIHYDNPNPVPPVMGFLQTVVE